LSEQSAPTPFSFDFSAADVSLPATPPAETGEVEGLERLKKVVEASGAAAYHWIIDSDEIVWSANVEDVLGIEAQRISAGRSYAAFLDAENFTTRYDTVMRSGHQDDGSGVAFEIEYQFRPEGRGSAAGVWLEDHGKWYAGPDGRPREVFGTVRRIDARYQRDQHLSFLGNCDPLTGMMNRGRMAEALGEAMTVAGRDSAECAFVIAAINNLSVVNEAYGFEVADEVIVNVGRRLRQVVRTGDAIARYSGSKFGIILNNCTEEDLHTAAERFLGVARESVIETERGPVWALLSIGGLVLPQNAQDANTAMARAEEALTEARRLPSDGYVVYKPSAHRTSRRRLNAHSATEIVRCLREDRFRLAFQPVVAATDGAAVFHEALLRMTDTAGEVIAAAHLIPVAEKLGLVRLIDRAVVQMCVATLNTYPDARLSINISGTTATDPRWYPQITEILSSNRSLTGRLIVEITETVALSDLQETRKFVEQLRELGCGVAIDDFGAGFTSFRNLRSLPVDILKLDGTFCHRLAENQDNQYFVRSLIDMAHKFDLRTVVEWVESEEDASLLRSWNADFMQGNLFGEANLTPPWQPSREAARFNAGQQVPFIPPSEIAFLDDEPPLPQAAPEPGAMPLAAVAEDTGLAYSPELESDLAGLRSAIAALDTAFRKRHDEAAPPAAEPSFADLVSDSRKAG
jgi:diguanylate cyclase (GGDEF)-like protein